MTKRRNPFEGLVYYGDWHTPLLRWLDAAEEGTSSNKMLESIAGMKKLLIENDECIHTETAFARVPESLDVEFAADCARDTRYGEVVSVTVGEDRHIHLGQLCGGTAGTRSTMHNGYSGRESVGQSSR